MKKHGISPMRAVTSCGVGGGGGDVRLCCVKGIHKGSFARNGSVDMCTLISDMNVSFAVCGTCFRPASGCLSVRVVRREERANKSQFGGLFVVGRVLPWKSGVFSEHVRTMSRCQSVALDLVFAAGKVTVSRSSTRIQNVERVPLTKPTEQETRPILCKVKSGRTVSGKHAFSKMVPLRDAPAVSTPYTST